MNFTNLFFALLGFCAAQLLYAVMDRLSWRNTLDELHETSLGDDSGEPGNHLKGD